MAKVVITFTDESDDDNVKVQAEFDPVLMSTDPNALTPAQIAALVAVSAVHNDEELFPTTRTLQ